MLIGILSISTFNWLVKNKSVQTSEVTDSSPLNGLKSVSQEAVYDLFWNQNMTSLGDWSQLNNDPNFDPDGDNRI
jgi:hypothetical protein